MQMNISHQQQIPQGQTTVTPNQAPNTQPQLAQMSSQLPIQISHGQIGQTAQGNSTQIISSNNANTMFQVK